MLLLHRHYCVHFFNDFLIFFLNQEWVLSFHSNKIFLYEYKISLHFNYKLQIFLAAILIIVVNRFLLLILER